MIFGDLKFTGADYGHIIVVFLLMIIGLFAIYSASYHTESQALKTNFTKQILWFVISIIVLITIIIVPFQFYRTIAYWAYALSLIFLILPYMVTKIAEVHRWVIIGPFRFQPSEFAKISVLLTLARYLGEEKRDLTKLKEIGIALGIVFIPFVLVLKQPDLGTALVFISLILPVLYWAGLSTFALIVILAPIVSLLSAFNFYTFFAAMIIIATVMVLFRRGIKIFLLNMFLNIGVGVITPYLWGKLHTYQQHRILTFLGLKLDPHGAGYQVIQSKVAIGSGGFWGKGFLNGTQTQLRFLPAQHTDFVFSVIGEEFGFIGVVLVLALFFIILFRGIYIASVARNRFASLLTIGAVTVIAFHVIVTIGMTVGVMPVTGIPLPFLSYGGSSLITSTILLGFIINTSIRRYKY